MLDQADSRPAQARDKLRTDSSANKPPERANQSLVVVSEVSEVSAVASVQDLEVDSDENKN